MLDLGTLANDAALAVERLLLAAEPLQAQNATLRAALLTALSTVDGALRGDGSPSRDVLADLADNIASALIETKGTVDV